MPGPCSMSATASTRSSAPAACPASTRLRIFCWVVLSRSRSSRDRDRGRPRCRSAGSRGDGRTRRPHPPQPRRSARCAPDRPRPALPRHGTRRRPVAVVATGGRPHDGCRGRPHRRRARRSAERGARRRRRPPRHQTVEHPARAPARRRTVRRGRSSPTSVSRTCSARTASLSPAPSSAPPPTSPRRSRSGTPPLPASDVYSLGIGPARGPHRDTRLPLRPGRGAGTRKARAGSHGSRPSVSAVGGAASGDAQPRPGGAPERGGHLRHACRSPAPRRR